MFVPPPLAIKRPQKFWSKSRNSFCTINSNDKIPCRVNANVFHHTSNYCTIMPAFEWPRWHKSSILSYLFTKKLYCWSTIQKVSIEIFLASLYKYSMDWNLNKSFLENLWKYVLSLFPSPRFYCARTSNFHVKKSQYWNAKFGYSHVSTNWLPLLGKTEPSTSFAVLFF